MVIVIRISLSHILNIKITKTFLQGKNSLNLYILFCMQSVLRMFRIKLSFQRKDYFILHIDTINVGPLMVNSYLVMCENTKEATVIDPGEDEDKIKRKIGGRGAKVKYILLTHGHVDHIGAVAEIQQATGAEICIHRDDVALVENAGIQASFFNLRVPAPFKINQYIKDGDELQVGELTFCVMETPGHSPGGVCYLCQDHLFAGDTLFQQSIGRTDFPGGSHQQLLNSISKKLLILPDRTKVYPGHGPATTIGNEKRFNPFLAL